MPDKKYLIEIPDMPDGSGVWDADKWERNKDAFMADYPNAQVFELGEYDEADSKETDQILLSFEDEASSGIWDQAKWERNKYAFTKDNPEAQVSRVRYVDYWGQKAEANRAEKAALQQPDEERNAKLAELGYYDDLSEGQRVFDVNAPSMIGLKPLSSAIDTNSVSGHTTYLDPRVQEFFANDSAYTDKMAEIARLDAEYDENPAVIAQREWEAQMLAEQKAYADNLEKEIKGNLESDVDMRKAARGGTAKRGYDSLESQQMSYLLDQIAGEEAGSGEYENEKLERYTTSLKFLEKAKIARDLTGKGFGGAVIDWGKEGLMDAGTQDDVEAYNEIGNILTRLEKEVGNLKEENLSEDVFDKYLSKDEQALIKSFFEYNKAMADAQQDMSRAYKGGKIFAESIPFMLEFLATGGIYKGAGRVATKGLERALVKWVSKAARNTASRTARKIAAATARDLTYALVGTTARTLASPGTYERMAEASVEIEDGHLNRAKNAAIAAADMYVENLSEISGGLIGKTLGWAGKGVGKLIAKTPLSKVGGMLADNKLMQSISAFMPKLEALGFHGLPEEIGEEFIGNAIREVLNIQPGALKEMVSDDNFGAMLIGFAPMTLIGAAGGAISLGAINYEAAKLGNKMREMMSDHYSAEEMDAMMSTVQNAGTAEEIQQAIKPMALAIANAAERGMLTQEQAAEEIEMLYQWGGFMAQNNALLFSKRAQDNELANAKRAEMADRYGRFWQEDETESVQVATLNNGSTVFVTSAPAEDGKITTIDVQTGKKGFANISDIASTEVEGEQIQSSNKMTMAAFLNGQIAMGRKTAEETRMTNERNAQIDALRAEITPGTRINLGTEGSPVYVFAKKTSNNGVTIVDETGMESTLGWEQAADALGKPIIVETDQQKLDAEVSARLQRLAERRMQRNISPAVENATAEAAEESAEVVAQEQKHIPLNEDGTVNEAAFWTQDPEGYAEWNDEQNQDGGQDTLRQIAISKAEMFALLAEAQSRQNTSNPAARKAAEKEAAIIAEKIQRLQAMEMKYADALAEEKEAVKQTAATPTATMSEEQLEQMDTQYQGILGKTRIQSERVRVMQEYLNKLAEDSAPIRVLTKDNYEEVMRAEGCPEDDIKRVGKALNRKRGGQVAGFASNGVTFVMANTIADINSARITYIHERQHLLNSQNPEVVKQFAAALGDKENALRILETFVDKNGLEEYKNDSIERLADEIICRSMEIVYSTENYSVDLQNQGLSEEAINIINTIDNGQRTDKSLSSARRSSYVNGSRRENIEENGRNSEQVSGGILGEQETGSLGSSGRGDGLRRQGSTGEGAEVISEEQLNAPNSGTAQQITAADGEVLADTNGKGGVRFSIRTWNEGGRDYLAAWLANDAVLTEEEKADILARMDEFYKNALLYSDTYVPFGTWSDAEVRYDNEGNPLMSVVKANGDYAMNLDFSLVCKKRRPLNRLLRTLINRNAFGSYDLKEREIAEINWILQEHGFEVACALCFVDSKRYRVAGVADVFAKLWNNLVTSLAPNGVQIAHFNYNDNPNVEPVENGLDTLPDDQLNWKKLDKAVAKFKKGSVEYKVAQYLREHPEARKLVDATDFIEAEGFEAVKEANPDLLKFYNMKKGTGGPKASFGDVQYLNDILKSGKKFDVEKAYAVGGVRLQSFSDFVPHMYFDYMQLFAELAAKKLPLHAYTKEVLFAKIFGLTGAKINMSLVPAVVEGGVAPGLDAEGNYAWADPVTDAEGNVIQQGQSFPYDEAMAIQQTEGYSKNCGVIAVGISDAHIEKMMEDPNIPFIIPYHKSSLNAIVARMTNIDQYKDYTNVQNTRKASGSKLDKGTKDFNFNEYLHGLGESGTPQMAAQAYLDWCKENKFIPKFSQFAYHPSYYKLLQDFNTIDLTTGEYAPQGAVTMTFPTEESAFGNVETLIQQGLQEDAALEEKMEQEIDGIADQVVARLEEIAKEPKMSDKQRVKKMAELADERMAKIKEQSGVIDLVEEAKKAVAREEAKGNVSFRITPEMKEIKKQAEKDGTFMKAPNGQPTNLTEEQWLMVRTQNFKNWFGDWENDPENASKVVDENGEPKVVFHQTNQKIYVNRETGEIWDELGWKEKMEWDERDDWEDYWEEQDFNTFSRVNARTTNEFDGFFFAPEYDEYHEYGDRTIAAFVNIKNPASREDYNIDSRYNDAGRDERIRLQEAGFDGVIRMDGDNVDEYIAFEPNQIKSATDNNGDFNPNNNDIRFRITPEQDKAYMDAVEAGDMETAQRMVIEAAKLAMPNTKVVDENGNPKVVYHGTGSEFYTFRNTSDSNELGAGYYFSDSYEMAERYATDETLADNRFRAEALAFDIFTDEMGHSEEDYDDNEFIDDYNESYTQAVERLFGNGHVKSVFLNLENPRIMSRNSESFDPTYRYGYNHHNEGAMAKRFNDGIIDEMFEERHEGLTGTQYVAFNPSQIKSADPVTYDNDGNVIPLSERFNPENEDIRFRIANESQAIFVSNAAKAVEGIKMEKATPEQWLKMIEKNGGLKAGEDKWMGLSDWLKASDKKTLTKQEVLDFINEHMIVIEEQHYSNDPNIDKKLFEEFDKKYPGNKKAFIYEYDDYREKPYVLIDNLEAAVELYNANHEDKVELDEFDSLSLADEKKVEEFGNQLAKEQYELLYYGEIRSINSTRLQYTTEGLNNNHEIALTVPTIESWNEGDDTHFGDAGEGRAVAWIRFGETEVPTAEYKLLLDEMDRLKEVARELYEEFGGRSNELAEVEARQEELRLEMRSYKNAGHKVLVIDEIQSKRHQEGREKGYRVADVDKWLKDSNVEVVETGEFFEFIKDGQTDRRFSRGLMQYDIEKAKRLYVAGYEKSDVPDAPFDKNWHELAMKRMLRYAAENGYDVIAWTKGEQQAERYGIGKVVSSVVYRRTEDGKRVRVNMRGGESLLFDVDVLGKVTEVQRGGGVVTKGMPLSEIVGSNLANQIGNYEGEVDERGDYNIKSEDFRIGGEGMKGFYDRILPAFMNKYGKKWGVKVEDIDLPNLENGLIMHSVPVTEEMKASVMGGQVMFRMRTEEEDAMEFQESVLEEFKQEYRLPAPTTVVDVYDRDAVANALGYAPEKFTDAQYDFIIKGYQKGGVSIFDPETKRIAIFAKDTLNESWKMYDSIFHENTHFLVAEHPDLLELGEWLWQNSEPLMRKTIKEHILANDTYKGYETDEMLSGYTGVIMATGKADVAYAKTPEELRKHWDLIFNAFGYGRKTEDNPRRRGTGNNTGRVESSGNRADASAEQKHNDAAKQELTAEERRVIGEYFPEFNKSEDVRMKVNSQGKDLTEGQKEFFANSKAVDKDGNLLVLYHGTPRAGFTEFKSGWFTTSKEDAISYSGDRKGRLFDPDEKYEPETLTAGDFRLGYMTFDSEEDRTAFLERFPYADEVMSEKEYEDARMGAEDEEYDALTARRKEFAEVWNAYREYERERFVDTTIGDLIANPETYTEEDLMRAMLEYDSNATFDNLDDMSAEERKDALVSALQTANEETEGGILDMVVPTRVPRNGEGLKHNDLGNRTYEVYANVENPYEIDAKGRGSEFESGDIYKSVEEALADEQYDGIIIRNWRVGRTQQLGDVIVPKDGSQIKLTSNENPSESSDIQFRITEGGEESDIRFSIRTKPAPEHTITVYKMVRLGEDGQPYPLFIGSAEPMPVKTWLDADSPNLGDLKKLPSGVHLINTKTGESMTLAEFEEAHPEMKNNSKKATNPTTEAINWATMNGMRFIKIVDKKTKQTRYSGEKRAYYNLGIDGGGSVSMYGMRPGWHAGSHPVMRQIGNGPEKNLRADNHVWVRGRISADVDYQAEANANPGNDIPTHIPTDGYYLKATNANAKASQADRMGWYISGSFIIDEFISDAEARRVIDVWNADHPDKKLEYDFPRESGVEFDPETDPRLNGVSFRVTGTPTDEVVTNGLQLTPAQTAEVAANIFAALPEESRKKITDGLNGNILGLQDAILQIPTSLATKENWDEEDIKLANAVRTVMQDDIDKQQATSRPLTTKEALWMLYDSTNTVKNLVDAASRAFVAHSLGFDQTSMQRKAEVDDYVRFRTASGGAIDAATDMYNFETSLWTERLKESWLDMNQSVISLQKAMTEASGMSIEPWENLEFALNRLSSKSYADKNKYLRDFLIPMWDTILDIVKHDHVSIEDIERYMMLKHGLERNKKFASRDAKEFYRAMYDLVAERMKNQSHAEQVVALSEAKKKLADIDAQIAVASSSQLPRLNEARARAQYDVDVADLVLRGDETQNEAELQAYYNAIDNEADPKYREFREKDYGGLTSMFVDTTDVKRSDYKSEEAYQQAVLASTTPRYDDVAAMESAAEREVSLFENKVYMYRALWDKVNAATKETLRHQYESGMITREQYEAVRDMFEFYVPLRGFADNTAEDMYSYYMTNSAGGFTKPILAAKGRKTRAESPLGWIGTMAESAIQADNKNEAKMCLYYATLRRPDQNLLAITETWYEYTGQKDANGKKIFKAVYPPAVSQALSADDLRQHMDTWEADMKQKQSRGEAYKGSQRVDLKDSVVFQDVKEEKEHIVRVKVAGQDYSILINGNPRAAQAINGLLNPDANVGPVAQWIGDARRSLSALLTSYSPLFWVANYQRDLLSSTMRVSEANGWNAAMKYLANRRKAWRVASYIYKYDAGTLGDSYYEKLYKEFADNGGVTGYTALTTNKEYENLLEKYANNVDKHLLNAVKGIWDKFIGFGEAIEQVSRFAAFITAREEGKSIEEAINAAKEVSVNFNRKGSAKPVSLDELDKLRTKDGKKLNKAQRGAALILSAMPGPMKFCYYFVNASIQALSSSVKLAKKSPGKATTWVGMYMGTSIALAMLNYLLSDDDDDEYLNLPDYLRHSTALVKVADGYYFKWSIPQEMRPFYAWADILVRKMMGKMPHKSGKDVGKEMALAASQWLPVNPFEAEDPLLSLIPDFASPLAEIKANTNAFGGKIYDDMAFKSEGVVKEIPAYRKATEKTGDIYVDISEFLNDVSGGDEVTKGMININPAIMEHLIEGYGGGIYDFAKMMVSIPSMILSDDPVQIKEIPFVNKVILSVDETNMYSHTNEAFFHYKDIADNAKRVEKEYRESDDPSRADDYQKEEDWRVYLLYKQYEADFKNVKERLDNAVDKEEEDLLKQEQNVLREMFLNDIAKGDLPEVTFQIREDIKRIDKEIKEAMKPVSDANKERLEKKNAGDVDGMLKAIEKRDSLKETPEYRKAEEMKADLKEIKRQLEELGTVTRSSQRDSVIGEIQKNYDALIRKRAEL